MATDYGRDTHCERAYRSGRFADGILLVGQNLFHRLITPRGELGGDEDEEDYGFDLEGRIGSMTTASEVASLPGQIRKELLKDQRIESVTVKVTSATDNAGAVTWTIEIVAVTGVGPFTLVLAISDVTLELLNITEGDTT